MISSFIKKFLSFFVCFLLVFGSSFNSFAISANDAGAFVTRGEFNSEVASLRALINSQDSRIEAVVSEYLRTQSPYEAGNGITIIRNAADTKWVISLNIGTPVYAGWAYGYAGWIGNKT